jgi:2-dehydro-3-deoxygluconokinase
MANRRRKRQNNGKAAPRAVFSYRAGLVMMRNAPGTGAVLSIGECMVEFFDRGDGLWQRGFAGDTVNVAWALRALLPPEVPVGYVTRVGSDAVSDAMLAMLSQAGIGTDAITRDAERTLGLYTIATDAAGERSFTYWRSTSAARHLADDPAALARQLTGARLVYLSGITAAVVGVAGRTALLTALERVKAGGARVAYDPNYRPRLWESVEAMQDFASRIVALADILLPTFDDESAGFGDASPAETAERLTAWGCGEVLVKNGARATVLALDGAVSEHLPPQGIRPLDTTGAGDAFNGGYLAGRLVGRAPADAVKVAQAVAARVVLERGALAPAEALRQAAGLR